MLYVRLGFLLNLLQCNLVGYKKKSRKRLKFKAITLQIRSDNIPKSDCF